MNLGFYADAQRMAEDKIKKELTLQLNEKEVKLQAVATSEGRAEVLREIKAIKLEFRQKLKAIRSSLW